ncbi:MAG: putative DNA binding domain-containing protein [Verrucomicrobia bacterium]|nr:putative DNA binding domain-containing protein [Verrucomicrobiota bacterium]
MKYPDSESSTLEFKQEMPQKDQIFKTVIGFCNQNGGKLIIGVADNGSIIGIPPEQAADAIESLSNAIYDASTPPILPLVYIQTIHDKTLLVIEVSSGTNKPYYRKSEGLEKGTYIRLGPLTVKATADFIEELKWQARGKSYDMMPVYGSSENDLDPEKLKEFIQSRKTDRKAKISNELLRSYYLIAQEHAHLYATTAGILLFGKQPQYFFTEAMIICSHFKGIEGREALATIDCTGTLFEQFEQAYDFIFSRLTKSFTIKGPRRQETLEVPEEAIREALLNLIVHRNYHQKSPSKIAIYQNRIEFFSPGTFFGPLNTQNLKLGLSFIRNAAICKAFRESDYIEKMGSGFIAIFNSYEKKGLKTPMIIEGEGFVKCILPREPHKQLKGEDAALQQILGLFDLATEVSISDVAKNLSLPKTTAIRKLNTLLKSGVLKKKGKGPSTVYYKAV